MNFLPSKAGTSLIKRIDDLIKLHQSMVNTKAEAHSALSKAVQQAHDSLKQQSDFAAAVEGFQQQLSRELENASDASRSYFAEAVMQIQSLTQYFAELMTNIAKRVEDSFQGVENVRQRLPVMEVWLTTYRIFTSRTSKLSIYNSKSAACSSKLSPVVPSSLPVKHNNGTRVRI